MTTDDRFNDEMLARLSDYLDGSLGEAARIEVERALAADERLRAELAALKCVDELVRAQADALPELDWTRFADEARRRRAAAPRSPIYRLYRPLAAAAAVAFVATAALLMRPAAETAVNSVAVVTVERAVAQDGAVSVEVSRTLPTDALVVVGPAPRNRTLIVTVGADAPALDEDEAALF